MLRQMYKDLFAGSVPDGMHRLTDYNDKTLLSGENKNEMREKDKRTEKKLFGGEWEER